MFIVRAMANGRDIDEPAPDADSRSFPESPVAPAELARFLSRRADTTRLENDQQIIHELTPGYKRLRRFTTPDADP